METWRDTSNAQGNIYFQIIYLSSKFYWGCNLLHQCGIVDIYAYWGTINKLEFTFLGSSSLGMFYRLLLVCYRMWFFGLSILPLGLWQKSTSGIRVILFIAPKSLFTTPQNWLNIFIFFRLFCTYNLQLLKNPWKSNHSPQL